MKILSVSPRGDYAANMAAEWGAESLKGRDVFLLQHNSACSGEIKRRLTAASTAIVCYFGHGGDNSWDAFTDDDGRLSQLVWVREVLGVGDSRALAGLSIVSVACLASRGLGKELVRAGARVFVGWSTKISWRPSNPCSTKAVGDCICEVVKTVIAAYPAIEKNNLQRVLNERYEYWQNQADVNDPVALSVLGHIDKLRSSLEVHSP